MRTFTPAEGYISDILTHSKPLNNIFHFKLWLEFACTARFPHLKSGVEIPTPWGRTGVYTPPNIPLYTSLGVYTGIWQLIIYRYIPLNRFIKVYRYIIARYTGICRTLHINMLDYSMKEHTGKVLSGS